MIGLFSNCKSNNFFSTQLKHNKIYFHIFQQSKRNTLFISSTYKRPTTTQKYSPIFIQNYCFLTSKPNIKQSLSTINSEKQEKKEEVDFQTTQIGLWEQIKQKGRETFIYRFLNIFLKYWWIRHALRAFRFLILTIAIYQTGYRTGIMDYAQDPKGFDKEMTMGLIKSAGATDYYRKDSEEYKTATAVASRIVKASRDYVDAELLALNSKLGPLINNPEMKLELRQVQNQIDFYTEASNKLRGEWFYIVTTSQDPNAFLSDLLPRRLFINDGLLKLCSQDELALVIAHEVSHIILDQTRKKTSVEAYIAGAEVLLLAFLDPTV